MILHVLLNPPTLTPAHRRQFEERSKLPTLTNTHRRQFEDIVGRLGPCLIYRR
ncbi:hypothetical protein BIFDEN_01392 [Bifidobacterium dentium ATCC 27678]|nr:hypothetical protein BIFDEN_01392 [Bifidobacterium dentium ATCC 27678]